MELINKYNEKKVEKALNKINERIKREVKVIYNRTGYASLAMLVSGTCFAIMNELEDSFNQPLHTAASCLLCSGILLGAWSIDVSRMENISNEEMCEILKKKEAVNTNVENATLEDLMAKYKDTYAELYLNRKELGRSEFKKQEADLKASYANKFNAMNAERNA